MLQLQNWIGYITTSKDFFQNMIIAVIILLMGFTIGKIAGRLLKKVLYEAEIDTVAKKVGVKLSIERKFAAFAEYAIYAATLILALNRLGATTLVLQITLILILILLILFMILSLKDFMPNAIARIIINKKKLFKKGDIITVHGVSGKVDSIGLAETRVISKNKDRIHIPNSAILKEKITVKKKIKS